MENTNNVRNIDDRGFVRTDYSTNSGHNLRNKEKAAESIWDWDFLNSSFNGKMHMSDIDGVLERKGFLLFIETKNPRAKGMSTGQRWMYESMAKNGCNTVIIVWGENNQPDTIEAIEILTPVVWGEKSHSFNTTGKIKATREDLQKACSNWYKTVETKFAQKMDAEVKARKVINLAFSEVAATSQKNNRKSETLSQPLFDASAIIAQMQAKIEELSKQLAEKEVEIEFLKMPKI